MPVHDSPPPEAGPDSGDRLVDDMLDFLRGGPVPDPAAEEVGVAAPAAVRPQTGSWEGAAPTADPVAGTPVPADGDTTPDQFIGPYRVVRWVERGGMGDVSYAVDRNLGREAALKTIRAGLDTRPGARERFQKEAAAVAKLSHPNIIRIYDYGDEGGRLYFAMEWAAGGNLAARLKERPLPPREAAALVRDLARAIDYAHGEHVLHRDLKPNNVLLTADGTPKVADFGLALLLDDDGTRLTATEAVMGTPAYMAPEQARGRVRELDVRTDVYALGAILYEAVTGAPPFTGESKEAILERVRESDPPKPSSLAPGLPRDLEAVCLRCLSKDAADRYPTAGELSADLDRFLAGEPTVARPPTRLRLAARAVRKRWRPIALVALIVAGAGGGAVLLTPRPEPTEAQRLAEARAALAAELDRGGPVVLIPEKGKPKYGAVIPPGDNTTNLSTAADGSFQVSSWSDTLRAQSLIELVPDPRRDSYLFRVRVRHAQSDPFGIIGVYVCDQAFPGPTGGENGRAVLLKLNDIKSHLDVVLGQGFAAKERPARDVADQPNRVSVHIHGRGMERAGVYWQPELDLFGGSPFIPTGTLIDRWRTLEVRVTPAGLSATMDQVPVGTVTAAQFRAKMLAQLDTINRRGLHPCWDLCNPDLNPRGGLGLVVRRGVAAFRDAVIEPLNP